MANALFDYGLADIGSRIQQGIDQSQERRRKNALLDLEQRRVGLAETAVANSDRERQRAMQEQQRNEAHGLKALAAARGDRRSGEELLSEIGFPLELLNDKPENVQDMFEALAEKYGGFSPPSQAGVGQLYQVEGPQGPQYATGQQAIGQRPYNKPSAEARGTWSQPFEATDPESGKPGMYQSHSISGQVRPANVGNRQIGPKPKAGGQSTAAESLIYRQVVGAFGGVFDPVTGSIVGLDKESAARVQGIAARASRIHADSKGQVQVAEAVNRAMSEASGGTETGYTEGQQAFNPQTGTWIEFRNGRWVPSKPKQ